MSTPLKIGEKEEPSESKLSFLLFIVLANERKTPPHKKKI